MRAEPPQSADRVKNHRKVGFTLSSIYKFLNFWDSVEMCRVVVHSKDNVYKSTLPRAGT